MSVGYLEMFRIAADCLQVLLCVALVILLVKVRKRSSNSNLSNWPVSEAGPFMHEFMLQSLKHQCESSFDSIEKTISAERRNLLQLFEISGVHMDSDQDAMTSEAIEPEVFQMDAHEPETGSDQTLNRYQQVALLAADGLKAPRIAKQLGIPRGEVDLVLKMAANTKISAQNRTMAVGGQRRHI